MRLENTALEIAAAKQKICLILILFFLSLLWVPEIYAANKSTGTISWGFLIINLFGGLAFFLYGMEKMSTGMKR